MLLAAVLVAAGCGKSGDQAVTETRELTAPQGAAQAPAASSAERFGLQGMPAAAPAGGGYKYATPEGWVEQPPTQFRLANFKAGANGEVEVYLSKAGGGVANNVNRWRTQMGLPALSEAELAQLPKKPVLGQEAVFVNWEGTFGGMQGTDKKEGYRLAGVILEKGGEGVFVKMVGPAAAAEQELGRLDEFTASLLEDPHAGHDHGAMGGDPHAGMMGAAGGDPHAGMTPDQIAALQMDPNMGSLNNQVTWSTTPEGWEKAPDRAMRVVTFKTPEGVETYVSVLSGMAGGAAANISRWRNQMGVAEPVTAEQLEALPKIEVLGQQAPLVEIPGSFKGMSGEEQPNSMLIGTVAETPGQTVFVKMTGPEAAVQANKDKFVAFSQSLKLNQPAAAAPVAPEAAAPAPEAPAPTAPEAAPSSGTAEPQPQP
jgi:hypothetical protein